VRVSVTFLVLQLIRTFTIATDARVEIAPSNLCPTSGMAMMVMEVGVIVLPGAYTCPLVAKPQLPT
jgi:hypothetical protein